MKLKTYIHVILQIFVRDLSRLIRNPVALIVVLGVCLMPSLYAWYTILANWDPYQNTSSIKVAIVNNDEGADLTVPDNTSTEHLNVGQQVVEKLHDNHDLGWEFVDEDEAMTRVHSGEYYAAIIIPEDFSKDFASVASGTFVQPTLDYYVNEKLSSIAPKVTDAGATALQTQINDTFVETVTETVVEVTQKAGYEAKDQANGAIGELENSIAEARDALSQTETLTQELLPTIDSCSQTIEDTQTTLTDVDATLPGLTTQLEDARTQLVALRTSSESYAITLGKDLSKAAAAVGKASAQTLIAIARSTIEIRQLQGVLQESLSSAQMLLAQNQALIEKMRAELADHPEYEQAISQLEDQNAAYQKTIDALKPCVDQLGSMATQADQDAQTLNNNIDGEVDQVQSADELFHTTIYPQLLGATDNAVDVLADMKSTVSSLHPLISQTQSLLTELKDTLAETRTNLSQVADSLASLDGELVQTETDLSSLQGSTAVKELSEYLDVSADEIGEYMAAPVKLETIKVYPVANYGSGVAPFFSNLALWVAGFILMAIVKLRVDPEGLPRFTTGQAYWGRWLLFMLLAIFQGLVVCIGDLIIGIQCESPLAFVFAGLVTVIVDVNIMFALAFSFKHIGKAIAVILLIMQIPGSSGMFPVEMMPPFFQFINPLLPFTYSIDAMREAIGGFYGLHYWQDIAALLLFLPLALFVGLVIGLSAFNLNILFDRKLGDTDLFASESNPGTVEHFRVRHMLSALLNNQEYRARLDARAERFQKLYPKLIRAGWIAIFVQPIITFAIMVLVKADIETKILLLLGMVVAIIVVDGYLIVVEFINADLTQQQQVSMLSTKQLRTQALLQGSIHGDDRS
ncbi:YhgE/Pip domain-containing protein [Eggerthellaceae bacterium 3-80]|nr:YhgE/Pip domain-containing protein [bacterium D16-34]